MLLLLDTAGGTAYDSVICLTNWSINDSVNVIDANSFCGPDKEAGTIEGAEIQFEGQLAVEPTANEVGIKAIYDAFTAKSNVGFKIGPNVATTGDITWAGTGFISQYESSAAEGELPMFTATLTVKGVPTLTVAP